jgi:hypothetical protein
MAALCTGKPAPPHEKVQPLLDSIDDDVLVPVIKALFYQTEGDAKSLDFCIRNGVVQSVVKLLSRPKRSRGVDICALRILGNVASGSEAQTQALINAGALALLRDLICESPIIEVRREATWTISNVLAGSRPQIRAVISCGILPVIMPLLSVDDAKLQRESLWCVSNAATTGSKEDIAALVDAGCIPRMISFLDAPAGVDVDQKCLAVALEGGLLS